MRAHREVGSVSAHDALPTAYAVEAAKRVAAKACCELAAGRAWPDLAEARACLDLIPYVALEALSELCLDVKRERLARCLGLDPLDGVDELARRKAEPGWPADLVETVLLAIGGGR